MLRVSRLELERYRAIQKLRLPDGMPHWNGRIPDVVVVAGPNGSGKTTLLELIQKIGPTDGLMSEAGCSGVVTLELDHQMWRTTWSADRPDVSWPPGDGFLILPKHGVGSDERLVSWSISANSLPSMLVIPSEGRTLTVPETGVKRPGTLPTRTGVHIWKPGSRWEDSFEATLYTARWYDLNAKEEGRPDEATRFKAYADAFTGLFPTKELVWVDGVLVIRAGDTTHSLSELSSGEKQILLLIGELYTWWYPGSLVLIDEPELHLHPALQVQLLQLLLRLQAERGGQLWIATQSREIYAAAPEGSHLHLGAL